MITKEEIKTNLEKNGAGFGLSNRLRHPSAIPFISNKNNARNIFDLEKTAENILEILEYVKSVASKNGVMLFSTSRAPLEKIVRETAEELKMPFSIGRWVGGTLSNFKNIISRVNKFKKLEEDKENNKWDSFTKKERILLDRELLKLKTKFGGISELTQLPDCIILIDANKEKIALKEAVGQKIKTIAITNSDTDLREIDCNVVTNISSIDNVRYIMDLIKGAYREGVKVKK